eukprot:jgi/Galph1/1529/GphlegSOOS_G204.1
MVRALIIVDIQHDFLSGGSLEVPGGEEIIPYINKLRNGFFFDYVVLTQDWHPANHISFAINHPGCQVLEPIELNGMQQVLWPVHCVQNTKGSELHPNLIRNKSNDIIIQKGVDSNIDSYSAFWDNGRQKETELRKVLSEKGVTEVFICGLAFDFCVAYTCLDAVKAGFVTHVIVDCSRAISTKSLTNKVRELSTSGVSFTYSCLCQ